MTARARAERIDAALQQAFDRLGRVRAAWKAGHATGDEFDDAWVVVQGLRHRAFKARQALDTPDRDDLRLLRQEAQLEVFLGAARQVLKAWTCTDCGAAAAPIPPRCGECDRELGGE